MIGLRFERALATYDAAARVQRESSEALARLAAAAPPPEGFSMLDVGTGTGVFAQTVLASLAPVRPADVLLNDLSPTLAAAAAARLASLGLHARTAPGSAESLVLADDYDLILCGWCLQWLEDPMGFLVRATRHLAPGGRILLSVPVEGTCAEVRALTGRGLDLHSPDFWKKSPPGTRIEHFEACERRLLFSTPRAVLEHLRATGATGTDGMKNAKKAPFRWTRASLETFEREYFSRFGENDASGMRRVALTYRFVHCILRQASCPSTL